ncbi:MAG: hypothetical protein ABFS86_18670 [Planctomycetota bacterium]
MTERTGTQGSRIWTTVRLLLVVALVMLLWVAARRSHAFVARHPAFIVDPAAAVARAPAEWLTGEDLVHMREASGLLGRRFSFFTPGLEGIFRRGYEGSPWVRRVTDVRLLYPNRVAVAVEVRKPVCGVPTANGRGMYLIDESGVRLPGIRTGPPRGIGEPFLVLTGVTGLPPEPGEVWSGQVWEGAAVARDLTRLERSVLSILDLTSLDVSNVDGRIDKGESEITLVTKSGVRIEWGRSRHARYAEFGPDVDEKFELIRQALRAYPRLAGLATVKLHYDQLYIVQAPSGAP